MVSAGTGRGRRSRSSNREQDAARPGADQLDPDASNPDEPAADELVVDELVADEPDGWPDGGGAAEEARSSRKQPEDPAHQARDVVYRLLAVRARSRSELRQALVRKGFDEELADAALQKFADAGLIDDAEFARAWVSERHGQQGLGRHALGVELRRKGVAEHVIDDALSTVDQESEVERARELVRRKLRGMAAVDGAKRTRRLVSMLARKGYSEGMAFRVVREELERASQDGADPDLNGADPDLERP